jgi:3-hydroxyisobutyrate dehydrogenase-like beta-hydroxyacid dehydrogenase
MAAKIVLMGAGGKMGVRSAANLAKTDFEVAHVEISEAGRARLKEAVGVDCVDVDAAMAGADVAGYGDQGGLCCDYRQGAERGDGSLS